MSDRIHPVGSIYMSVSDVSPATLFGGTWARIQDTFLLAAGNTYDAGDTGGAATVTLSTANMPSHSHGLNSHRHTIPKLSGTAASNGNHTHGINIQTTETEAGGYGLNNTGAFTNRVMIQSTIYQNTSSSGAHTHSVSTNASNTGNASGNTASAGSGTAHNNMPPYLAVYVWKRTA